jgi:ornithine cyclodeaminase/alanine dehydrogenase-like protein (mu-crystallin family)
MAREEAMVDESDILAEIGELLIGSAEGRRDQHEITLFKSLGLAVEDIAAGDLVYRNALAAGAGTRLELGGLRHG